MSTNSIVKMVRDFAVWFKRSARPGPQAIATGEMLMWEYEDTAQRLCKAADAIAKPTENIDTSSEEYLYIQRQLELTPLRDRFCGLVRSLHGHLRRGEFTLRSRVSTTPWEGRERMQAYTNVVTSSMYLRSQLRLVAASMTGASEGRDNSCVGLDDVEWMFSELMDWLMLDLYNFFTSEEVLTAELQTWLILNGNEQMNQLEECVAILSPTTAFQVLEVVKLAQSRMQVCETPGS